VVVIWVWCCANGARDRESVRERRWSDEVDVRESNVRMGKVERHSRR
jgi:hypothetical protein